MTEPLLLSIDQGTQSVRAMVFDLQGNLLAKSQVEIEPYFSREPGWAEQDCDYFWEHLCQACQQLWQQAPELKPRLIAAALTTQRASVVCLDSNRQPLRPAIIWLDRRRARRCRRWRSRRRAPVWGTTRRPIWRWSGRPGPHRCPAAGGNRTST